MPDRAERYFSGSDAQRSAARTLFESVADLPLICPHGHVDPLLFADASYHFGSPAELLLIPDHYVFRMLYSQGVPLETQGVAVKEGEDGSGVESDHRKIWQTFAENYHLFQGTPTGLWLNDEFRDLFGIDEKLAPANAQAFYDRIAEQLAAPEFTPRQLYEQFNVEALTTTDAATDSLEHHRAIRDSGWAGRIYPTFRPDKVVNGIDQPEWQEQVELLREAAGIDIGDYAAYIRALEVRRVFFKGMGATATDHAAETPYTEVLSGGEAEAIFGRGLAGQASEADARRFTGHMLVEMARMSSEDGLVMQLHPGSAIRRGHGGGHSPLSRFHTQFEAASGPVRLPSFAASFLVHTGRSDERARDGAAGRPLPDPAHRPALVVLRQHQRDAELFCAGDGDGGHLQHGRLQ